MKELSARHNPSNGNTGERIAAFFTAPLHRDAVETLRMVNFPLHVADSNSPSIHDLLASLQRILSPERLTHIAGGVVHEERFDSNLPDERRRLDLICRSIGAFHAETTSLTRATEPFTHADLIRVDRFPAALRRYADHYIELVDMTRLLTLEPEAAEMRNQANQMIADELRYAAAAFERVVKGIDSFKTPRSGLN